ncbi:hypothetical protein BV898_00556 [Hypsibius exemplaris]|uniref:Centromere protein S n=1 Tax=Hypsibius exemplaris TaxID=2072580 RepID=A0A1W0XDT1_HYPEX|nr:hypothetical protein BV898_00556 [Hypsibius exemplaris]
MDKDKDDDKKGGCRKRDPKEAPMLRSAVHYTVYKLSEDFMQRSSMTLPKETVLAVADHIFLNMEQIGRDLEFFSKHARRMKVTPDDVKLLFRNAPDVGTHLDAVLRQREKEKRQARPLPAPKAKKQIGSRKVANTSRDAETNSRPASPGPRKEQENDAMDDDDF